MALSLFNHIMLKGTPPLFTSLCSLLHLPDPPTLPPFLPRVSSFPCSVFVLLFPFLYLFSFSSCLLPLNLLSIFVPFPTSHHHVYCPPHHMYPLPHHFHPPLHPLNPYLCLVEYLTTENCTHPKVENLSSASLIQTFMMRSLMMTL